MALALAVRRRLPRLVSRSAGRGAERGRDGGTTAFWTAIAIPIAGLIVGITQFLVNRDQQLTSESQRHHDQIIALAGESLQRGLALVNEAHTAVGSLEQPCATGDLRVLLQDDDVPWARPVSYRAADRQCGDQLLDALRQVDRAILNTSWTLGSMPIDRATRNHLTVLTRGYFHPCADDAPWETCGWRARTNRLIHGFGLPAPAPGDGAERMSLALTRCHSMRDLLLRQDGERAEFRRECRALSATLRTEVTHPLWSMSRITYCSLQIDAALFTADSFEFRFAQDIRPTGAIEPGYRRLAGRLRDAASRDSMCLDDLMLPPPPIPTTVELPEGWPPTGPRRGLDGGVVW